MARQVDRHYKSFVAEVDDPGFFLAQPGEPPTEHAVLGKVCFGETPKPTRGRVRYPERLAMARAPSPAPEARALPRRIGGHPPASTTARRVDRRYVVTRKLL